MNPLIASLHLIIVCSMSQLLASIAINFFSFHFPLIFEWFGCSFVSIPSIYSSWTMVWDLNSLMYSSIFIHFLNFFYPAKKLCKATAPPSINMYYIYGFWIWMS
jgi:hypothetical protein